MPMPHRIQAQLIKRRLVGKEGQARVNELRAVLAELPGYKNGPYAELRKWVEGELVATRARSRTLNRDSISVRREGAAQVAVAGPPNVGKSSLLQALSEIQIRTGDFAFTTLRPVPAVTRIRGVIIQLVEIPGLIEGAHQDRGGGRALLGVLRGADAILLCHAAGADPGALLTVRSELAAAGIAVPTALAATKLDEAPDGSVERLAAAVPDVPIVAVSVLDEDSLDRLREAIWSLTGLIRVFLRKGEETDERPLALRPGATVLDVADAIHHELARRCTGARMWGPSVRHPGQKVGKEHEVSDGDVVAVLD
jgi:ribosome-interacting GTPase 1